MGGTRGLQRPPGLADDYERFAGAYSDETLARVHRAGGTHPFIKALECSYLAIVWHGLIVGILWRVWDACR